MPKVNRSTVGRVDKMLILAERHRTLEAEGNREATTDRDANVIFGKAWRLEMQMMATRAFSLAGAKEQLAIIARHMDHGGHEASRVASPKVKEALSLLQHIGLRSARAHRLIDEALAALVSMEKRTGLEAGITLSALSNAEASLSRLRSAAS